MKLFFQTLFFGLDFWGQYSFGLDLKRQPNRSRSIRLAAACIISIAQQESPQERGHMDFPDAHFDILSKVDKNTSGNTLITNIKKYNV